MDQHAPQHLESTVAAKLQVAEALLEQFAELLNEHLDCPCKRVNSDDHQLLSLWYSYCADNDLEQQSDNLRAFSEKRLLVALLKDLSQDSSFR